MGTEISSAIHLDISDFQLIEKALIALSKKNRGNAEKTKTGYGSCKSYTKHDDLLEEANRCEEIITMLSIEFS